MNRRCDAKYSLHSRHLLPKNQIRLFSESGGSDIFDVGYKPRRQAREKVNIEGVEREPMKQE